MAGKVGLRFGRDACDAFLLPTGGGGSPLCQSVRVSPAKDSSTRSKVEDRL